MNSATKKKREEVAQKIADDAISPHNAIYEAREAFDAGHACAMEEAKKLTERINAIAENIGIDAVQVHHETIWVDPNNVRLQLEQSIKSCERWAHQLREALAKFRGNND
jgi:ribonuclease HII